MSAIISGERYAAAARHSRLVRRLRWLLPALVGIAIIAFIGLGAARSFLGSISFLPVRLDGSTLEMAHPHLTGYDANRRRYSLSAERARQDIAAPSKIQLDKLDAHMELTGNNEVRILSEKGFFDGEANRFIAQGNVRVNTTLGYELFLKSMTVLTKTSSMESEEPVEVRNGDNRIFADRMQVHSGGERIVFDGRVKTIFHLPQESP